jgi:hypothetical protein
MASSIQTNQGLVVKYDEISRKINKLTNKEMDGNCAGVYIGCNETATEKTKEYLKGYELVGGCHVGFSSWHNFDIMVERSSTRAVLCDFNPRTKKFLEASLLCFSVAGDRNQFARIMEMYVKKNFLEFSPNVKGDGEDDLILPDEEIIGELTRQDSWLSTDAGFLHIKQLALQGKISIITEDIRNEGTFKSVAKVLKTYNISIDTLYISNICNYMKSEADKNGFITTVRHLFTHETKLIHATHKLVQTTLHGSAFTSQKIDHKELFDSDVNDENAKDVTIEELTDENFESITVEDVTHESFVIVEDADLENITVEDVTHESSIIIEDVTDTDLENITVEDATEKDLQTLTANFQGMNF